MAEDHLLEYIEVDGVVSISKPVETVAMPREAVAAAAAVTNDTATASASSGGSVLPAGCVSQSNAIWGLSRISSKSYDKNNKNYYYGPTGANVDAYVLDTGIYVGHNEFGGRAEWGVSFVGESTDGNGHGTHCAGTIGGTLYGVAKEVRMISVQVMNAQGSGSMSGVIAGVEWACAQHNKDRAANGYKCVISMSLSGQRYNALDQATNAAATCGCVVVVAAGNDGNNACNSSPAAANRAITVGATKYDESTNTDMKPCVAFTIHILVSTTHQPAQPNMLLLRLSPSYLNLLAPDTRTRVQC
jgi:cerevisin